MSNLRILCFSIGLLVLLAMPFWLPFVPGYSPKDKWLEVGKGAGNYHFFAREIYEKKGDIDILILGHSLIWNALDAGVIEDALSKKLGRKATVLNFGSNWQQEDVLYLLLKELTDHRRVKMLIIDMPVNLEWPTPHKTAPYWWIMGEHMKEYADMDTSTFLKLYAVSILGMPRHVLNFIRPTQMLSEEDSKRGSRNGELLTKLGYKDAPYKPPSRNIVLHIPPEDVIYSDATKSHYEFTETKVNSYTAFFLRKIFETAAKNHIHVVVTSIPESFQVRNSFSREITDYRNIYPGYIDLASLAPQQLYSGMSDDEVHEYFYDNHMNINGTALYTNTMMPTILELYGRTKP